MGAGKALIQASVLPSAPTVRGEWEGDAGAKLMGGAGSPFKLLAMACGPWLLRVRGDWTALVIHDACLGWGPGSGEKRLEGGSGLCDESRKSLSQMGSLAQQEAGTDSLESDESFPMRAVAQCRLASLTAFGWVSGFCTRNTGKCTLTRARSQPCSLSNEETEAGSRCESQGDLPTVDLPSGP